MSTLTYFFILENNNSLSVQKFCIIITPLHRSSDLFFMIFRKYIFVVTIGTITTAVPVDDDACDYDAHVVCLH